MCVFVDEEIEGRFETFLSDYVAFHTEHEEGIRTYLGDFPFKAKSLFKRGAGQFFLRGNNLKFLNTRVSIVRDVGSLVVNEKEWFALHMLQILSRGGEGLGNDENLKQWLLSLDFKENKIRFMEYNVKVSLW